VIDIHSHILAGLDDGPDDELLSLSMARGAVARGLTTMVATPHVREDHPANDAPRIRRAVGRLQALIDVEDIGLVVLAGGEVAMGPALELAPEALRDLTLAGRGALLLETPHGPMPSVFEPLVEGLLERGLRVVLAHPELNPDLQRDPARLGAMVDNGALVQVTATSLGGGRAPHKALAVDALRRGWVHVIASDAHAPDWRPPDLEEAREAAGDLFGWLTEDVPQALIAGEPLPEAPRALEQRQPRVRWTPWRR
jgi:protein-tyrosine phosphatase